MKQTILTTILLIATSQLAGPTIAIGDSPKSVRTKFDTVPNDGAVGILKGGSVGLNTFAGAWSGSLAVSASEEYTLEVSVNGTGFLNVFVDWQRDENWDQIDDHVLNDVYFDVDSPTVLSYVLTAPIDTSAGTTFVRLRASDQRFVGPGGDGEVEDHEITIRGLDFGDAPSRNQQISSTTFDFVEPFADFFDIGNDGNRVAYVSNEDLVGSNADRDFEVFSVDRTTGQVSQVTNGFNQDSFVHILSFSNSGERVAFESRQDPLGTNADGSFEVFFYDVNTNTIRQITDTLGGDDITFSSWICGDGSRIVFLSKDDLLGSNADGNDEVYLFDIASGALTQITTTVGSTQTNPSISDDGTRIAYASNSNPLGTNADGGVEAFLLDTSTSMLRQISDTAGAEVALPQVSASGGVVAFQATNNPFGENNDGTYEVFLYNVDTDTLVQATRVGSTGFFPTISYSLSGDGTRVLYAIDFDLNVDGEEELFLFDSVAGTRDQITDIASGVEISGLSVGLSMDGSQAFFETDGDPTGGSGTGGLYRLTIATDTLTQVTPQIFGGNYQTSLDGSKTIFSTDGTDPLGTNSDRGFEIFLADDVTGLQQISFAVTELAFDPTINADGTRIAFVTGQDLLGGNPDGNIEVFLQDTSAGTLTQITSTTSATSCIFCGAASPSSSADGTRIAFDSDADPLGANPDFSREVFLFDTTTSTLTQITNGLTSPSASFRLSHPAISADGTRIAFTSGSDLLGTNGDGNSEIFLFDTVTDSLLQITETVNTEFLGNGDADISGDGSRIVFDSFLDLLGMNTDGSNEIFLYEIGTATLSQITDTAGSSSDPAINGDGTRIVFDSTADFVGTNADGNGELFLFDAVSNSFQQITNTTTFGTINFPDISADGARIGFSTNIDLLGTGNSFIDFQDELFLFDTTTNTLSQLTDVPSRLLVEDRSAGRVALNADGSRITFEHGGLGANIQGSDIFLAMPDVNYPTSLIDDGARHIITPGGPLLGTMAPDPEPDGQADAFANGDDSDGVGDDEEIDDAEELSAFEGQSLSRFSIDYDGGDSGAFLNAWIDLNIDGDWLDPDEQVLANVAVPAGQGSMSIETITLPANAATGVSFIRFRISEEAGLTPGGDAPNGEVEDYQFIQKGPCSQPYPDFIADGRVDGKDALELIAILKGDGTAFDLTGDGMFNSDDAFKFSLSWYAPDCALEQ